MEKQPNKFTTFMWSWKGYFVSIPFYIAFWILLYSLGETGYLILATIIFIIDTSLRIFFPKNRPAKPYKKREPSIKRYLLSRFLIFVITLPFMIAGMYPLSFMTEFWHYLIAIPIYFLIILAIIDTHAFIVSKKQPTQPDDDKQKEST